MLIEALQSALAAEPTITALLGRKATRPDLMNGIFPMTAPDAPSMPYLTLEQLSGAPDDELMSGTTPLTSERWRIASHGTTYLRAKLLAKTVRLFLPSLYGPQPGSFTVQSAAVVMEADEAESLGKGTLFTTNVDVEFVYVDLDS